MRSRVHLVTVARVRNHWVSDKLGPTIEAPAVSYSMESPDVYNLTRIPWQFFGTLTFRSERLPEQVRRNMWFSYARKTCDDLGVHFLRSLWCLRQENGELTGRRHFHYLLGGFPKSAITIQTCMVLKSHWQKLLVSDGKGRLNPAWNVGGGWAEVRVFNRSLNGVGYVSKCLSGQAFGASLGADLYEMSKFGLESAELVLSKGASAKLMRGIHEGHRYIERQEKRDGKTPGVVLAAPGHTSQPSKAIGLDQVIGPSAKCARGCGCSPGDNCPLTRKSSSWVGACASGRPS